MSTPVIDSFSADNRFLSNFYPSVVEIYNKKVPTVEHGYQAAKADSWEGFELICGARSAGVAKKLGRQVSKRDDWETLKDGIMLHLLQQKFQIPMLKGLLLATGDTYLVEGNTWGDRYWGVCKGTGLNKLGIMLMQVREEIR